MTPSTQHPAPRTHGWWNRPLRISQTIVPVHDITVRLAGDAAVGVTSARALVASLGLPVRRHGKIATLTLPELHTWEVITLGGR